VIATWVSGTLAAALPPMTRYDVLVDGLAQAGEEAQRRYASAALAALVRSYEDELAGRGGHSAGLPWQRGTREFVARLERVQARLRAGATLEVVREGRHAVRLIVDAEQVMVSAARPDRQADFEAAIARALCERDRCAMDEAPTVEETVVARERELRGEWALADRAPPLYAQEDGLHCVFEDLRHLQLKQQACVALTRELRLLEEALRAVFQHGGRVDWQVLTIGAGADHGDAGRRRVSYDASGRYFELDLPLLAAAPDVVQGAIPWLQTRLRGQPAVYVITAPERLAYRVPATDR
jgi:hypothetical protein